MGGVRCRSIFFFSSRRRHTRFKCDWSSDVCSSDLRADSRYKLNRLLVEIIATIRTTSIPLHETGNYFKSKDEMIENIRQARIYLIMAMEVIHPADLSRRILRDMGPEQPVDFYRHLNTCRAYLKDALKNW